MMANLRNHTVALFFVLLFIGGDLNAQYVARPDRGKGTLVPMDSSGVENINLQNGNLSLSIPLASLPAPPGGKLGFTVSAHYNSKVWDTYLHQRIRQSPGDGFALYTVSMQSVSMYGGWRIGGKYDVGFEDAELSDYIRQYYPPGDEQLFHNYNWSKGYFSLPDGTRHEIQPLNASPFWGEDNFYRGYYKDTPYSTGQPMRYYTSDGSYIWLTVYPDSYSPRWEAHMPDGTTIEQQNGIQRIIDRNDNKIKIFTDLDGVMHYQDEYTGREIKLGYNPDTEKTGVSYQSTGGIWNTIEIVGGNTTVSGKFQNVDFPALAGDGGCMYQEGPFSEQVNVVREIRFPGTEPGVQGRKYVFAYNSDQTSSMPTYYQPGCYPPVLIYNNSSKGWGELSQMTTPAGAVHKYTYYLDDTHVVGGSGANSEINAASNTIRGKQVIHDGQTDTWKYDIHQDGASVINPDGSTTTLAMHTHYTSQPSGGGGNSGLAGLVYRETTSNRIRIERNWQRQVFTGAYEFTSGFHKLTFNPVVTSEFTTLLDSNGNPELMSAKLFQYDFNGNLTQTAEYDWFSPQDVITQGNFPVAPPAYAQAIRVSTTSYYHSPFSAASLDVYAKTSAPIWNAVRQTSVGSSIQQILYDNQLFDVPPTLGNITGVRAWDNVTSQWISTLTSYDARGNVTSTTDANGNSTQYTYGSIGGYTGLYRTQAVTAHGSAVARTATMAYDFHTGLATSVTDVDNNVSVSMQYDIFGRPIRVKNAVGTALENWQQSEYRDSERLVVTKADRDTVGDAKAVAIQHFDQLGRVRLSRTLENALTESPYNAEHGIKVETRYGYNDPTPTISDDPENTLGVFALTSNPYRASTSASAVNETTMGWTLAFTQRDGRYSETTTFAGADLPPAFGGSNTNSTGVVKTDIAADRTLVTDQAGRQRMGRTNSIGHLKDVWEITGPVSGTEAVTFPGYPNISHGYRTSYSYDVLSNLTQVSQGLQMRNFAYSSLSRLTSATNVESGTIDYTYDANGNLKTRLDDRNIKTIYDYDELNRITKRCYRVIGGGLGATTCAAASGETPEPNTADVTLTYGTSAPAIGKLTKVESGISTTEYTSFDILGRVTGSKQTTDGVVYGNGMTDSPMTYSYNLSGALLEQQYPSGRKVRNILDHSGDLSVVRSRKNGNAGFAQYAGSIAYNAAGAVTSLHLGNGNWESTQFNSRLQPTQIALGTAQNGFNKLKLNYEYGVLNTETGQTIAGTNNGNISKQFIKVLAVGATPGFEATQYYAYDSLNRLQIATENIVPDGQPVQPGWRQHFEYDRYGNRNFVTTGPAPTTTIGSCQIAVCNPTISGADNRITSAGYAYDNRGNTTSDPQGRTFVYDGENKQVEVLDGQQQTIGEYSYDGDGKRVKKRVPSTGETTVFVYDAGGKLVAEYSTIVASSQEAEVAFLTSDNVGSPRLNTDAKGAVTARHDYHPFGEEISAGVTSQRATGVGYADDTVSKRFTGYERDDEIDLDFAQARFYSYRIGRFQIPDPISVKSERLRDPQQINLYVYVRNNPLVLIDPSVETIDDSSLETDEKYQAWKKEFLSTEAGRKLWDKYHNDKKFTLVIRMDPKKDNGAETGKYEFQDGKLVGATITLGKDIGDRADAANRGAESYPLSRALGKEGVDTNILAAAILAHEFGHVEDAAARPAVFQAAQEFGAALDEAGGRLGSYAKAGNEPGVVSKREAWIKLAGATDVTSVSRRNDLNAETTAIEVVQQSFANRNRDVPRGVRNAIDFLQGKRNKP